LKTNIVLVSLNNQLSKKIGEKLSKDYDLYFADIKDILQYNLQNEAEIESICGVEYLNNLKEKTIKDVSTYENTLITLPYELFIWNNNYEYLKKYSTIVYLKQPKSLLVKEKNKIEDNLEKSQQEVLLTAFEGHNQLCEENSDVTIDIVKDDFVTNYKKIKKVLDNYYL